MELQDHVQALFLLGIQDEILEYTRKIEQDMESANSSQDFKPIIASLVAVVGVSFSIYGNSGVPTVRAFVGHVLAECPDVRVSFIAALGEIHPALVEMFS